MQTIAATWRVHAINCGYDTSGIGWVSLADAEIVGWLVDDVGNLPPLPVVIGGLSGVPPATDPVISPRWAMLDTEHDILVPNAWRGGANEFFTWLATNNGATRQIDGSNLRQSFLQNSFADWAARNPDLVRQ